MRAGRKPPSRSALEPKSKDRVDFTVGRDKFKSELVPAELILDRFFAEEHAAVQDAEATKASAGQELEDLYEEHGGEDGLLADLFGDSTRISRTNAAKALKQTELEPEEKDALTQYLGALDAEKDAKAKLKAAEEELNAKVAAKYGELTLEEIQGLVIDDKWLQHAATAADAELQRMLNTLTGRPQGTRHPLRPDLAGPHRRCVEQEQHRREPPQEDGVDVVIPGRLACCSPGETARRFLKGSGLKKAEFVEGGPESCIHYGELFTHYRGGD